MTSYEALAASYDGLMTDVQYKKRADYLERLFQKGNLPVTTVLDLGCGTGTMAYLLQARGYQVTAVDASEEMLTQAVGKADALCVPPPLFLQQKMPCLRLASLVDAAISTVDALNYLTGQKQLQETLRRVYRWLKPGGQFIFDINSSYKLRRMDGQVYLDETEESFCVWRTAFSEKSRICTYGVDLFRQQKDGTWVREWEEHRERAWEEDELRAYLKEAGFARVTVMGDLTMSAPGPDEDRLIFRCEKRGE